MRTPDWQSPDGAVQLHCCDCLELLPQLEAGSVDLLTDPPYGAGFAARPTRYQRANGLVGQA